jgi:hypothetical protein
MTIPNGALLGSAALPWLPEWKAFPAATVCAASKTGKNSPHNNWPG